MKCKIHKTVCTLFGSPKIEKTKSHTYIFEEKKSEFDSRFGFILRNKIDSQVEYEKTKLYYVSKELKSTFPVQETL